MRDEIETGTSHPSDASLPPPARRAWIVRNEKFLRTIFMIAVYVFGAMCLVSILALGAFAFISGVLAGMVLLSVLAIVVLLKVKRRPRRSVWGTIFRTKRDPSTRFGRSG